MFPAHDKALGARAGLDLEESALSSDALAGIRVVELSGGRMGAACAKHLADFGADVVKVEPPEGDPFRQVGPFSGGEPHPERSALFLYLNANKRSVCLDIRTADGRSDLDLLLKSAHVFVTDITRSQAQELALDEDRVEALNPGLVYTSVTHFGRSGPYSDYKGSDLVAFHMGGVGYETPNSSVTDIEVDTPLKSGGYQAEYQTAWTAAAATMIGLIHKDTYGHGQLIDISAMDAMASMIRDKIALYAYSIGDITESRMKSFFTFLWPCKDGSVSTTFSSPHWWEGFKRAMGPQDWYEDPRYATREARRQHMEDVEAKITNWLTGYTRQELADILGREGVPVFPVHSMAELLESEQYRSRGVFVDQEHPVAGKMRQPGPPARLSETPWRIRRPAPTLGQHTSEALEEARRLAPGTGTTAPNGAHPAALPRNAEQGVCYEGSLPLAGVRVLDFGWVYAMPHCTQWLAAMGAEVLRVESNGRLEWCRTMGNRGADGIEGVNRAYSFNALNDSKLGITLNLREERARELIREIVSISDVVSENFTVGVLERMGLDYDSLRKIRPDLVMLSATTLGATGPERYSTGWGPNIQSYSGMAAVTGYEGGLPVSVGANWPDFVTGTVMAFSVLAALYHRRRTGRGQHIDLSMAEVVTTMLPEPVLEYSVGGREPYRMGNRDPHHAPHNVYACDGHDQWVAVAVTRDEEWLALCDAVGRPGWASDPRFRTAPDRKANEDALDDLIAGWTHNLEPWEATRILQSAGVPAGPVLNVFDMFVDPHLAARRLLVEMEHPEVGPRTVASLPVRFGAVPEVPHRHAPLLGEHNGLVFEEMLGVGRETFERLVADRVIY